MFKLKYSLSIILTILSGCADVATEKVRAQSGDTDETNVSDLTAEQACLDWATIACTAEFGTQCPGEVLGDFYINETDCHVVLDPECENFGSSWSFWQGSLASDCGDVLEAATSCDAIKTSYSDCFSDVAPAGVVVLDSSTICDETITPGSYNGTVNASTALFPNDWHEGHFESYCIELNAGDRVTFTTGPGQTTSPIDDTLIYLYAPDNSLVAYNDDINKDASNYYSQIQTTLLNSGSHTIVVSGYDEVELGDFVLTTVVE